MSSMDHFRYIIAEERRRAGLTQEALANRIGITPQAISKWENGVGFPDVTLFPRIAEVLDIPISRLFGEEPSEKKTKQRVGHLPEKYGELPFAFAHGGYVCYTDKKLVTLDETGGLAIFEDGSEARMMQGQAVNCGAGEIRVLAIDELLPEVVWEENDGEEHWEREFPYQPTLELHISHRCDLHILRAEDGVCRVIAVGTADFLAALSVVEESGRLSIAVESSQRDGTARNRNAITVSIGADHANLLKAKLNAVGEVHAEPDFDRMDITINGSADLNAAAVGEAMFKINGSGDIKLREVTVSADMHINGSGDITVQHCASPKIQINGSGDFQCADIHGKLSAAINGSGDMRCGGDVEELSLKINGCGDFHGKELSVTNAEIKVPQGSSAEITIGRIRGRSIERLSANCTLTVGARGEA